MIKKLLQNNQSLCLTLGNQCGKSTDFSEADTNMKTTPGAQLNKFMNKYLSLGYIFLLEEIKLVFSFFHYRTLLW